MLPKGELKIKTIAMPANTNANGDIFGGWLISLMDQAAGIHAKERAKCRVTTIAIDKMVFHLPVQVGDTLSCFTEISRVGKTSMTIVVEAWKTNPYTGDTNQVTEGTFTFVAINEKGRPQPVDRT